MKGFLRQILGGQRPPDAPLPQVIGSPSAPNRFLILCPERAATQEIHLIRPLRREVAAGNCSLCVLQETDLAQIPVPARPALVSRLWKAFDPTLAIFSRYAGEDYALLLDACRRHAVPVVAHIDDDLFNVPPDIGAAKSAFHNSPQRQAALRATFSAANLICAPTPRLAERLGKMNFQARIVVPPLQVCIDPSEIHAPRVRKPGEPVTIGYMGTSSHREDLAIAVPALVQLLETRDDVRFETFGTIAMPSELERFSPRVRHIPALRDYDAFMKRLAGLGWDIGIAPLRATEFNMLRTYTKWVELTAAGICVVASDVLVYAEVICDSCSILIDEGEWQSALARMIDASTDREQMVHGASRRLVRHNPCQILASFLMDLAPRCSAAEPL